jgi:outer membrane protein OmpA-like peptidoglycan-associated protein
VLRSLFGLKPRAASPLLARMPLSRCWLPGWADEAVLLTNDHRAPGVPLNDAELERAIAGWLTDRTARAELGRVLFDVFAWPIDRLEDDGTTAGFVARACERGWLFALKSWMPVARADLPTGTRPELPSHPPIEPPRSRRPQALSHFEVRYVDEIGQPIPSTAITFEVQGKHPAVTNGDGRARLDGRTEQHASVDATDRRALRELLRPRWDVVREAPWVAAAVDQTLVDLHDDSERVGAPLLSETLHTVVVQPWVVRARIDGFLFERDKAFVLPAAVETAGGSRSAVNALRRWFVDNPHTHALVIGHTDTTGDPSYNDPLSLERAQSFVAYLRQDVDRWLSWYGAGQPAAKRWGPREDRMMLEAISKARGLPITKDLLRDYQLARGLGENGFIGPETRRALIEDYMGLQDTKKPLPEELVEHGCGESFPRSDKPDAGGVPGQPSTRDDAEQRRVEVFLFDARLGVQPIPPGAISQAGSREYPEWVRRAQHTYELDVARAYSILLRVCNPRLEVLPGATVRLHDPQVEMAADEHGIVEVGFRRGQRARRVDWFAEDAPDVRYTTACFVEYEADDDGVRRKLHNLGYPREQPVEAFQHEFGRPITGNLDDVRDDVHRWHDHGPPPSSGAAPPDAGGGGPGGGGSAFLPVAFPGPGGPSGSPTGSPTPSGPSRATVVPVGLDELGVGVLVGSQAPLSTDSVSVVLTGTGTATVGQPPASSAAVTLDAGGNARFVQLSPGTFTLEVRVERASHAGGVFAGREVQTIKVIGRSKREATNVRIPLVTIKNEQGTDAPLTLLELGKTRKLRASLVAADPQALTWSGTSGIAIVPPDSANPVTISGASTSSTKGASSVQARQFTGAKLLSGTTAATIELVRRSGTHVLNMTVAAITAVSCLQKATPPISPRPWYTRPNADFAVSSDLTAPDVTDPKKILVLLRGSTRPLRFTPKVEPAGVAVKWQVARNPQDHASLGAAVPTIAPTGNDADVSLDQTGSFFVAAHLDLPPSESPSLRGMMVVMAEIKAGATSVQVHPSRWRAHRLPAAGPDPESGELQSGPMPPVDATTVAMQATAVVTVVSGGPEGRLCIDRVEVGWVNNVLSSTVRADYSSGGPIEVLYTQKSGSSTNFDGAFLPADGRPTAFVEHPIVDCDGGEVGGKRAALSALTQTELTAKPAVGLDYEIVSLDAPTFGVPRVYGVMAGNNSTATLERIEVTHAFRCFLCGWTENWTFAQSLDVPGRYTYTAFAKFEWQISGKGDFTAATPALVATPTTTATTVTALTPQEAHLAGCEVRGPGSLDCAHAVIP